MPNWQALRLKSSLCTHIRRYIDKHSIPSLPLSLSFLHFNCFLAAAFSYDHHLKWKDSLISATIQQLLFAVNVTRKVACPVRFLWFFLWYRNVFPWIWIIPAYFMWVTNWPLGCNIFRLLVTWTRFDLVTYSRSEMLHILFPFLLIYEFAQYKVNHAYKRSFLSEVHSVFVLSVCLEQTKGIMNGWSRNYSVNSTSECIVKLCFIILVKFVSLLT